MPQQPQSPLSISVPSTTASPAKSPRTVDGRAVDRALANIEYHSLLAADCHHVLRLDTIHVHPHQPKLIHSHSHIL